MQQELSNSVYNKLHKLVKEHEQLKKENGRLARQLEELHVSGNNQQQKIKELENQIAVLKNNTGQMDAPAKKEMERRINQYIKDIDNAILLLNE